MTDAAVAPSVKTLVILAVPAIAIGVGSSLMLKLLDILSLGLEHVLWTTLPAAFGATESTPWWIFTVLTATGAAVGLVVWLVPGHGGLDSAVTEMDGPFPSIGSLPSLGLVIVLGLAGGVSLGPENPIIAINTVLAMTLVARFMPTVPTQLTAMLAVAGTIGALFGTPVAAALVFTGAVGAIKGGGSLWDKLFLPLAAGGAGAVTATLLGGEALAFHLPDIGTPQPIHLLMGLIVAAAATAVAIAAAWVFPYLHRAFHALRNPFLFLTLGGAVLGLLGILGGPLTLFKGLDQTIQLLEHPGDYAPAQLALLAGVKLVALLVAASAGFRGGRVFPIVFVGVALGLLASAVLPSTPIALGVACAALGVTLVATRDGWIALFVGVALTGDITLLPLLCLIILPVWLMVTKAPELLVKAPADASAA